MAKHKTISKCCFDTFQEVEADKKHAAQLNALVRLVPSGDWPERKEPPEFTAPPVNAQKFKPPNSERPQHPFQGSESKKSHKFAEVCINHQSL